MKKQFENIRTYTKIQLKFALQSKALSQNGIDANLWRRKFLNLLKSEDSRCEELLDEFLSCDMVRVSEKRHIKRKSKFAPILFCVIKDDMEKIESFMEHYRRLGIEVFVFLDNNSSDGTKEFLCAQNDVIVWSSKQIYSSARRVSWLNRLLAMYGNERWCMIADSDELVNFIGSEQYNFSDIVREADKQHIKRIWGFMLDMYSRGKLFEQTDSCDYVSQYRYFDRSSYLIRGGSKGLNITGGPRKRVLGAEQLLSKCPIFYFGKDDIIASAHYIIPVEPIRNSPIWLVINHYKFLSQTDYDKVKSAVKSEIYAKNSECYKQYLREIDKNGVISFYDQKESIELLSTEDLKNISFLETPFEKEKK